MAQTDRGGPALPFVDLEGRDLSRYRRPVDASLFAPPEPPPPDPFCLAGRFSGLLLAPDRGPRGGPEPHTVLSLLSRPRVAGADRSADGLALSDAMSDVEIVAEAVRNGRVSALLRESSDSSRRASGQARALAAAPETVLHDDLAAIADGDDCRLVSVRFGRSVCPCPDFERGGLVCAHLKAAEIVSRIPPAAWARGPRALPARDPHAPYILKAFGYLREWDPSVFAERGSRLVAKAERLRPGVWRVEGGRPYLVSLLDRDPTCTCENFRAGNTRCKHVWAAVMHAVRHGDA